MHVLIRAVCAAALVVSGAVASAPLAVAYWGEVTTDLPEFVTGPTPFTVTVTDGEPCRMTFDGGSSCPRSRHPHPRGVQ
jgi:hypothetical protein